MTDSPVIALGLSLTLTRLAGYPAYLPDDRRVRFQNVIDPSSHHDSSENHRWSNCSSSYSDSDFDRGFAPGLSGRSQHA